MDIREMLETPEGDEPPMNKAIEDCLAMSGLSEQDRKLTLGAWMNIGAEYLAREFGRKEARRIIGNVDQFVREAQPSRPWKD